VGLIDVTLSERDRSRASTALVHVVAVGLANHVPSLVAPRAEPAKSGALCEILKWGPFY
jgi:hypothetical protein